MRSKRCTTTRSVSGADDLKLPAESLALAVTDLNQPQSPFVSANAAILGFDQGLTPRFRIDTVGGVKIGVTFDPGRCRAKDDQQSGRCIQAGRGGARRNHAGTEKGQVRPPRAAGAGLASGNVGAGQKVSRVRFRRRQLRRLPVPPPQPDTPLGMKTRLIEVSQKAEYVNVIGLFDDPKQPVRFERVALDAHSASRRA